MQGLTRGRWEGGGQFEVIDRPKKSSLEILILLVAEANSHTRLSF